MNRSRATLPRYEGEAEVLASKITGVLDLNVPEHPGAKRLVLDNGSQADMLPHWVEKWNPQAGGYFVIFGKGDARFLPAPQFNGRFRKVP